MTSADQKTSWVTWLIATPVLLMAVIISYMVWVMDLSLATKCAYAFGFVCIAYWLYTPKRPNQIIMRQIIALILILGLLVVMVFTFALMELRPEIFAGYKDQTDKMKLTGRLVFLAWILIFAIGAFFACKKIYHSLQRNLQLAGLFSRYVSPSVISQMLASKDDFFQTHKSELSVMFVDLRGFTSTSENLTPGQVKELINLFMSVMIPVAHSCKGTVDKTIGDAIMLVFGAPLPDKDHADQAVKTAIAFIEAYASLVEKWQEKALPILEMGIGINTGEMIVGNIGCDERVDYTVLGHSVNLGARICSEAAGSQILISQFTREKLSDKLKQQVPPDSFVEIEAKGIKEKIKAFSVNLI